MRNQYAAISIELSGTTATVEQTDPKHYCEMVRWGRENNTQQFPPFTIELSGTTATFELTKTLHYCSNGRWGRENNTQQFPPFTIELSGTTATFELTKTLHYCSNGRWGRENNTQRFLIELSGPTAIRTRVRGSASHCDIQATLWGLGNPSHPRLLFNNDGIVGNGQFN